MTDQRNQKIRLAAQVRLHTKTRWFYISALIITGIFSKLFGADSANQNFSPYAMAFIAIYAYAGNFIFLWYIKNIDKRSILSIRMISYILMSDIFFIAAIMFFAGGIISVSFIYTAFMIVASGFYYNMTGVMLVTTFVSVLYAAMLWGQYFDIIPYLPRYNDPFEFKLAHNLAAVIPNSFTIISSFYILGWFVGTFSKNILEKEERLLMEKEKEQSIITNLVDGLLFFNAAGRIELANKQAEKLLGIDINKVSGKNLIQLNFKDYPALGQILRLENTERGQEIESPISPEVTLKVNKFDVTDKNGRFTGTVILVRDVSRDKLVDHMKSEFITIAGHQLRTPLSAIKGAVSLLHSGDYGPISEEQKHVLSQVGQYNERLILLVNDFLNVSSIEQGRFEYKLDTVYISDLLREVTERFAADAQKKMIRFTTEVKSDLNPLELDAFKIKLALSGIINNALTYTPKRGRVEVTADFPDPGRVIISILDSGIGIPKDQQHKIFGKFFRAENALRVETEGNGLDLFVAKNIVENHRGKIWFKSQEGMGTTFFVELPMKVG